MQIRKFRAILLFSLLIAVFLNGCGSSNKEGIVQTDSFRASSGCIECHANSLVSSVTGAYIVSEWENGAHNTKNGAGCPSCHAVNGHPTSGTIPNIPGASICVNCHTMVTMKTYSSHFNATGASYLGAKDMATALKNPVMTGHANACLGCHNPHDNSTLLPVNEVYADSAHGAVKDQAFGEQAFIGNASCSRCHSGTGFRYYMTTGNQVAITKATLGAYSTAKETIGCNACHTNYGFKRISNDSSVTFATFSAPFARPFSIGKNFPTNVGDTKLCIPCHAGRSGRTGASITSASTSLDPHYFPAAGVMYMRTGFVGFTSANTVIGTSTYGKSLNIDNITDPVNGVSGGVSSTHRKLGTTLINGDSHNPAFFVPGNLDSGGPCVVCHMADGHSLKITANTFDKVCVKCHTSERGVALTGSNFLSIFVDENGEQMNNALALGVKLLEQKYDISIVVADIESPQESSLIRKSTGASMSWPTYVSAGQPGNTLTAVQLYRLKGAIFNLQIGYKENASFVHARSYMRRLIYDAIDWLDDGQLNYSVGATALSALGQTVLDSAGNIAFGKGTTAFADSTLTALATGTTPSMTYILGFNRTTGAWTTPERP